MNYLQYSKRGSNKTVCFCKIFFASVGKPTNSQLVSPVNEVVR